jgi:predicted TIM-barrel fold metal-dependent hydrolase
VTAATLRWDCHAHAFGPLADFPAIPGRAYEPPAARPAAHLNEARAAGITGIVWVQPSIYGSDNAALLATLGAGSPAIRAVIAPPSDPTADLARLDALGVRGLRLNLVSRGGNGIESLAPFHAGLVAQGWHVAAFLDGTDATRLRSVLAAVDVPVVLDHFGWAGGQSQPDRAAFGAVLDGLEGGRLWVKLSAPYQLCGGSIDCPAASALARDLLQANPDRVLFGSNWPHVGQPGGIRLGDLVARTEDWIAAAGIEPERIFSVNPGALYN